MKLKPVLRKATEIGIGLAAIATLILAGCGGSAGTTAATAANSTSATITPYKGPFAQGAIVTIKDANGNLVTLTGGTINASGVANVSFPNTVAYPLLVEVIGTYYNEVTGATETTTVPLRSVVASSGVAANVPVTIVTETAVADLQNQIGGGNFSATNPMVAASAVAALSTAGTDFGVPASSVPSFDVATHKSGDADTIRLSALATVANKQTGSTLADKVKALANKMATLNAASAPADVVSQADMDSAMTAMTSGALSMKSATATKPTSPTITTATASLIASGGVHAMPNAASFPINVAVQEYWGKTVATWNTQISNPYYLAAWIGLDSTKAFRKDSNGNYTYSASANLSVPTSSAATHYFANNWTATVANGILTITDQQASTRQPDGSWAGVTVTSFSDNLTSTFTYTISNGQYTYTLTGGQAVVAGGISSTSIVNTGTSGQVPVNIQ